MINFKSYLKEETILDELFDIVEDYIETLSAEQGIDSEVLWEHY